MARRPARCRHAAVLWVLTGLFFVRVVGQGLVAFLAVPFLPPMADWYSGLMPYPALLPMQIAMLAIMGWIDGGIARDARAFAMPRPAIGRVLTRFSFVYAAGMTVRYLVTIALRPEWHGFHGAIPIVFHFVLAVYLWTLGRHLAEPRDAE